MRDFRTLDVWQKAHVLTISIYEITTRFPKEELYGLTSQIRRACSSIPANIAEGCGKDGGVDFGRFLQIAQGSASELEYHFLLAHDLKLLSDNDYKTLNGNLLEIRKMLTGLTKKTQESNKPSF